MSLAYSSLLEGESFPSLCSEVEHESIKVWATTDKHASVMLLLWMSNTNWGFLITFTQNRSGRLKVKPTDKQTRSQQTNGQKSISHIKHAASERKEDHISLLNDKRLCTCIELPCYALTSYFSKCDEHPCRECHACRPARRGSRTCIWWLKARRCLCELCWTESQTDRPQTSAVFPITERHRVGDWVHT